MSVSKQTGALLENIPQRLVNFFARYPPQVHSAAVRRPAPANGEGYVPTKVESPYTPDRDAKGAPGEKKHGWTPSRALLVTSEELRNPFLPHKRFGKWEAPRYGLRQQADLMKLATKYNVGALLPPSRKSPEFKETRRAERGLQVKGTGVGHKVKGHKWERTMESRLEDRRKAMEGMPEMVRMWKQVSTQLVLPVEVVRVMLTRRNREVMAVAGDNGPSGNGDAPSPHTTASCFSFILASLFLLVFQCSVDSHANRIDTNTCTSHNSRSLGRSFVFEVYYQSHLYNTIYGHIAQWCPRKSFTCIWPVLSFSILNINKIPTYSQLNKLNLADNSQADHKQLG